MPKTSITFKVTNNEKQAINDASSIEEITISDYVRQAVMNRLNDGKTVPDDRLTNVLQAQLETKDDQIKKLQQTVEGLQQSLDQSQQLQAMTEKRYETEHQQLIEMKARSFWQKLTSVFE
tara:strand:- start:27 stop:386 length:360 start_codon:yes stop_codon:yes gene_type:complete